MISEPSPQTLFIPLEGEDFKFSCHKDIACFTACCARLKLILTPYDILRLKKGLRLSSPAFLDRYTDSVFEQGNRFPLVKLKMDADREGRCPFLSPEGCLVYGDRPGACRLYPLGRAASQPRANSQVRESFFIVREPHCLGFEQDKCWTVQGWKKHEGLEHYEVHNDRWLSIVTCRDSLGDSAKAQRKYQMFFMASYNLDRFRDFVFSSRLLEKVKVEEGLAERMQEDEEALLFFAYDWLDFSLFGKKAGSILVDL